MKLSQLHLPLHKAQWIDKQAKLAKSKDAVKIIPLQNTDSLICAQGSKKVGCF